MNRHLYRIIFNRKRGQLMAVAETATGSGKGTGTAAGERLAVAPCLATLRPLAFALLAAMGLAMFVSPSADAQIVAYKAAPASQQATVLSAGNGVPLVNIQTPSAAGVSRNTYSQFDVQQPGAILNNARTNTQTQLGGWVQGNPWLAGGTARVILNEVVSSNPSLLGGYVEVAGNSAQVVIANPAGVTCSGCGFINASRATLTTGTPIINGGNLEGYRVQGGTVRIDGAGMDANQVGYTDLIARAVEVNAGLWAQTLKITAGTNQVSADHTQTTPVVGAGTAPAFAIDVAQLGGMYAGKITLIGTEAGVGVRNAGALAASAGEVVVTADGKLVNHGTMISGEHALILSAQGVDNAGTLSSERNLTLSSRGTQGDVVNTGLMHAGRELVLDVAGQLSNQQGTLDGQRLEIHADSLANDNGTLRQTGAQALALTAGHVANSAVALIGNVASSGTGTGSGSGGSTSPAPGGTVTAPTTSGDGAVTVTPSPPSSSSTQIQLADGLIAVRGEIANTGTVAASGAVSLTASDGLANAGTLTLDRLTVTGESVRNSGTVTAADARLDTALLDNSGGKLEVARTLDLAVRDLVNERGTLRHTGANALALEVEGRLDNSDGQIASNATDLTLSAATVDNAGGRIAHAGNGALTLTADLLDGDNGQIESRGQLTLTVGEASLDGASTLGNTFDLTADTLTNQGGRIAQTGQGASRITVADRFDNRGGTVTNTAHLSITAGELDNRSSGEIVSNGNLAVTTTAGDLTNDGGTVSSQGRLTANVAGDLGNAAGQLVAGTDLALTTDGGVDNTGGTLGAVAGRVDATLGGVLDNTGGRLEAATNLALSSHGLTNVDGTVLGQSLTVDTHQQAFNNQRGRLIAGESLTVQSGALTNTSGLLQATGALAIDTHGQALVNTASGADGGIRGQGTVQLAAGSIDNSSGLIAATGNLQLTGAALDNAQGKISTEQTLQAAMAGRFDNTGGTLSSAASLALTAGEVDNRNGGQIVSNDALSLTVTTGSLANDGGTVSSQTQLTANVAGELTNAAGQFVAGTDLALTTGSGVDNTGGTLGAVAGRVDASLGGVLDNTGGRVEAATDLVLSSHGLTNVDGTVLGQSLTVDTQQQALDNTRGTLAADDALAVHSGALTNANGRIQASGALAIDTHGQALINTGTASIGGILGQSTVTLATGALDNSSGLIAAADTLTLTADSLANAAGRLSAQNRMTLTVGTTLDNQSGNIQAGGELTASATTAIDNTGGLMRAGDLLTVGTARLVNAGTKAADKGIEGRSVDITAHEIDNRHSAVRADDSLVIRSAGTLDNTDGLVSSEQTLAVTDESPIRTLTVTNTGGTLVAGTDLALRAKRLSGDGQILSHGDLTVDLTADFLNTGEVTATNNASVTTTGVLTNSGTLQTGDALTVQAGTLDNTASGKLTADTLNLKATDTHTLTNRGLIDGGDTFITAITLNNLGTGRIYGDHLAISATTLNNLAEGTTAPVIAARNRLDLGVTTLNNREHALLFSADDLSIGGALDANHRATGQATTVNNASATIEALGDLSVNAAQINNTNEHFSTQEVVVSTEVRHDYRRSSSVNQYNESAVTFTPRNGGILTQLNAPDGSTTYFYRYDYTRTTRETQIASTDPAKLIAGGNMQITAGSVLNDASQIVAGGALNAAIGTLTNSEVAGTRTISDVGTTYYLREKIISGDDNNYTVTENWGAYAPADTVYGLTLTPTVYQAHAVHSGSGTTIAVAAPDPVGQSAAGAGAADTAMLTGANVASTAQTASASTASTFGTAPGAITQVTSAGSASGPAAVVATTAPTLTLPANSLMHINPDIAGRPLVETDSAFISYRQWLSSDAMLTAMALDPATTQKRLGDGFYEQRLIGEQVAQLTGRRFLSGYADDETQYRALMDAGITVANEWHLVPGIALSEAQMAQLTTDIVWLVEREVTLADGTVQKVLVPQLYVRVQDGDVQPSGALIAADTIDLELSGDLTNRGTIAGRSVVSLTAESIQNLGGRISGQSALIAARQDLANLGGTLSAENELIASAGRDLTVASATRTQTSAQGSRTNIDRVAGLYVTGKNGTLVASAGRDLALIAAVVQNNGTTTADGDGGTALVAGRDLTLGTVTESRAQANIRNGKNYVRTSQSSEVGSVIQTTGDLALVAGHDLAARAADVTSEQGALAVQVGNDLTITAGEATATLDERHKTKSKGTFSSKTKLTHDTLDEQTALASTFSGDSVTLSAGQDALIHGSNVVATDDLSVAAGRNLSIESATEIREATHYVKKSQSGLMSSGGFGFTIGSKMLSTDQKNNGATAAASTLGSVEGDVTLRAGNAYRQVGSDVIAPTGDIDIAAKTVDILEARETSRTTYETKMKQSGLTVAITSPVISAVQTVQQMASATRDTKDSRMQALAVANTAISGYGTYDAIKTGQGTTTKIDGITKDNQIVTKTDANGTPLESRDATAADKVGGVNLSVSLGSSSSRSKTTQTSDAAAGSTLQAGGNLKITATGAGADSDITVQGSDLSAGKNLTLKADDEIKLLAAANTAEQHSTNKSSSASVGFSVGTDGFLVNVGASRGRGTADGADRFWTNSHVTAGETLTLESGGDTTLKGAVAQGDRVVATVGGDLKIESLQDTSTYDSKQKSAGFSLSVGVGKVSGSVSMSQSKVTSDYASVTEQSGIKAGDAGFQVKVAGDTELKGAVIASSQSALDAGKNEFETGGTLTTSDIQNHAAYEAEGTSVSVGSSVSFDGKLKPGGTSVGFGEDSDSADSTTKAGISGIAGNTEVRTGDPETGIAKIFDAEKVQKEIEAQMKITQLFGQQASKAVGDYASAKVKEANVLRQQAEQIKATDPERALALTAQAETLDSQWGANGTLRLAAHTVIGGLTGGASGAAGSLAGTLTAPLVADELAKAGIGGNLATAITALASTAVGGAVGGTVGAGTALNEVANNYLNHARPDMLRLSEKERYERAARECTGGNTTACGTRDELAALSASRDSALTSACDGSNPVRCNALASEAYGMGNIVMGSNGSFVYANSPDRTFVLNVSTIGPVQISSAYSDSYQYQQAISLQQGLGMAGPGALGVETISGLSALGFLLGSGFDAAGQYVQNKNGEIRPGQSLVAGMTLAVGLPIAARGSVYTSMATSATVAAVNTSFNNLYYHEDTSVLAAAGLGAAFSVFSPYASRATTAFTNRLLGNPMSYIPASGPVQSMWIYRNPGFWASVPPSLGSAAAYGIGAAPSFIPLDNGTQKGSR